MHEEPLGTVLAAYPGDLQPVRLEAWGGSGGFSGAKIWWLDTPRGPACLRRWPQEHPSQERLEFIQAVLWHVDQEGFHLVPVPYETRTHAGYVACDGHFWEITPWMPGCADYHRLPCPKKLRAAMTTLAQFHRAAATFPLPDSPRSTSPGMSERLERMRALSDGGKARIKRDIRHGDWPELTSRASQLCDLFEVGASKVKQLLEAATCLQVELQPCIRDIWHDHVFFKDSHVSAIIDFGAMRPENVAADVARLLGSMVHDDVVGWHVGLSAYQSVRSLSEEESLLVAAFDRSTVLMSGLQWLEWIYCDGRIFEDRDAVTGRLDEITDRLLHLANS
jgi:Ser/Thr protein kinase RdoA (MazF antagonist)